MTAFMSIVIFATITQVLVERIKPLFVGEAAKYYNPAYVSMFISIFVAVAFHVDLFATLNLKLYADPTISYILTGIIISGGSTVVNDLFKSIQNLKVNSAPSEPTPIPKPVTPPVAPTPSAPKPE